MELMLDSFAQCQRGNGEVVLVEGTLTSGKTALLGEFTKKLSTFNALEMSATGARAETPIQMGIIWQLFHSAQIPEEFKERIDAILGTDEMALAFSETSRQIPRTSEVQVMHALWLVFHELSRRQPLVICIDDLHFADEASLNVLFYVCRRIRSARIMLVFTRWAQPEPLLSPLRAEITRAPHRHITLGPLPVARVADALGPRVADETAAGELAPAYHDLTGGNPLLLDGLVADSFPGGRPAGERGAPVPGAAYRQAVVDCLQRGDPHLFEVAGALAILEEHATPALVGRLLSLTADEAARQLGILDRAGLLDSGRLRHREMASAIHSALSRSMAHLHAHVAELLYELGAEEIDIARHLVRGGTVLGPWAQQTLRLAARQALVSDQPEFAASALELALRQCDDDSDRLRLQVALTQVAWWVNPSAGAKYSQSLRDALTDGRLSALDGLSVVRQLLWQGNVKPATEHMETLTAALGTCESRALSAMRLSYEWIYGTPPDQVTRQAAGRKRSAARLRAYGLAGLHTLWSGEPSDDLVRGAENVLQGQLIDMVPEIGATALLLLDHAGQRARALHWWHVLQEEATRQGAVTWRAMLSAVGADMALRRGSLATAESKAREALGLLHTQSWGVLVGCPLSTAIEAATARGRHEQAEELLRHVVPDAMFDTVFGLRYLHARGHHHLAMGRPFAAQADFERCADIMRRRELDFPSLVPWRGDLAQAHLALRQHRRARELLTEQLGRLAGHEDERLRGITLRLLALAGPQQRRMAVLGEAVDLLERSGDHLELHRALVDMSKLYRAQGELGQARLLARRAEQAAKACGEGGLLNGRPEPEAADGTAASREPVAGYERPTPARAVARTVPRVLPRAGSAAARAGGEPSLSEAERKVATLAAFGHSNREIGRKLYITVSTVEQHLTRVYRKLNVQKREDLRPEILSAAG
ncbi:helix-turn-helix transcriptional regulator [Streptomyces marincola]|nr:hypothetical protein CAG99_19700 [Streptomyces marincola]